MSKIAATITKETKETKVGLAFFRNDENSPLLISLIREGGLFAATDLVPGMLVLTVNGTDVTGCDSKEAAHLLREAEAGDVTVVAKAAIAKAHKETSDVLCGVSLQRKDTEGVLITKIREGGLFDGSDLAVGLRLSSINGKKCPGSTRECIAMLKESVGDVTIVAYDPEWAVVEDEPEEEAAPVVEEEAYPEKKADSPTNTEGTSKDETEGETPEESMDRSPEQAEGVEKDSEKEDTSIFDKMCTICT